MRAVLDRNEAMPSQGGACRIPSMAIPPIHQGMGFCLRLDGAGVLNLDLETLLNDHDGVDFRANADSVSNYTKSAGVKPLILSETCWSSRFITTVSSRYYTTCD